MGHATASHFFVYSFRRARACSRHNRSLRSAGLHHRQTNSRDWCSHGARRAARADSHADSFARVALALDWFVNRRRELVLHTIAKTINDFTTRDIDLLNISAERELNWQCGGLGHGSLAIAPSGVLYAFDYLQLLALRGHAPLAHSLWPKFRCNARNTGNMKDLQE